MIAVTDARLDIARRTHDLVELDVAGRIDATMMAAALTRLVGEMEGVHHANMLVRDGGLDWPSLGAVGVELRHWGQMLAMVQKIDRIALLTDQGWLRATAALESALVPGVSIHSFAPGEEQAAREWLAGGAPGLRA